MNDENYIDKLFRGVCDDAKTKIVRAALDEFAMRSLSGARTRQIASKAGVNHAAISYYFGGKKELYAEVVRQICDFIHDFMTPFFARCSEIEKTKSVADAKTLVKDFVMCRVCIESDSDDVFRDLVLILTREELYQTEAFGFIFEKVLRPSIALMESMLKTASKGKYSGFEARIAAQMILSEVMMFNSARAGIKLINGWKIFGKKEYEKIEEVFSGMLDKILV